VTTLIVQLPPRDPAIPPEEWSLSELPFVLLDRKQKALRTGRAHVAMLPRANATVLMIAARDLLLLQLALPPMKGRRLMQALPNVVEDLLIQDVHTGHIAIDRPVTADGRRIVAVIDHNWFGFVLNAFTETGHMRIKAVPITRCLPKPRDGSATVAGEPDAAAAAPAIEPAATPSPLVAVILGAVMPTVPAAWADAAPYTATHVELAIARGELGEGMALRPDAIAATLAALAGAASVELYRLSGTPGTTDTASTAGLQAQPLPFETLARAALQCEFDLCQFEFAARPLRLSRATLRRWRVPAWLAGATILVAIVAGNLDWLMLAWQHAAMSDRQVALLKSAFPKISVILDPPVQMTRELDRLRTAAGELAPDDFLSLSNSLARSIAPLAPGSIAQMIYKEHTLQVIFAPTANVDDNFAARLHANGLSSHQDGAVWIIGRLQ
jgi:general secretion pathway protein L